MANTKAMKSASAPKALRFRGYNRSEQTEGYAVIAHGHDVEKDADWSRLAGNTICFSCSCGFSASVQDNAKAIQDHAHEVDPTMWADWSSFQTPAWAKRVSVAKADFKKAAAAYRSVRTRPDFSYVMTNRSAYAETEREFQDCADYLVYATREAYRANKEFSLVELPVKLDQVDRKIAHASNGFERLGS